ncbi:hypothetical protein GQ457_17G017720 [Hibiscus cannabinus]
MCWSWQGGPSIETHPEGSMCWSWQGGPINETYPESSTCWSRQGGPINETYPESSTCWSRQGGPINETYPEGSTCWSRQGGPIIETHPEGSICWSRQGGPIIEIYPEGSMCWDWQGDPRTKIYPEGSMCWDWQGGPRTETYPEGSRLVRLVLESVRGKRLTDSAVTLVIGVSARRRLTSVCRLILFLSITYWRPLWPVQLRRKHQYTEVTDTHLPKNASDAGGIRCPLDEHYIHKKVLAKAKYSDVAAKRSSKGKGVPCFEPKLDYKWGSVVLVVRVGLARPCIEGKSSGSVCS